MSDILTERSSPSLVFVRATMMAAERQWGGGVMLEVFSTLPFPLSLPSPFPSPLSLQTNMGGKVRSSEGKVPRLSPYKYHLLTHKVVDDIMPLTGQYAPRT